MKKLLTASLASCLLVVSVAFAAPQHSVKQHDLKVQVVQTQFNLTKNSFKSIKLGENAQNKPVVNVELTSQAAKLMHNATANNLNHKINLVWNKRVINTATIKSPLNDKFQISGLNKRQAQKLVDELQV